MDTRQRISPQLAREIAAEAFVTYATVQKWFACFGKGMKPGVAERVRRVAEQRGFTVPAEVTQ